MDNDPDPDREEPGGHKKDGQKVDFLQTGLSDEAKIPRWKKYAPSAEILGEKLVRDQPRTEPQTFFPTLDELANFTKYIAYMEAKGAAKAGIAKIKVPDEWIPRKIGYNPTDMDEITIQPIRQNITPLNVDGVFQTIADKSHPRITVDEYRQRAISPKHRTPVYNTYEELEETY